MIIYRPAAIKGLITLLGLYLRYYLCYCSSVSWHNCVKYHTFYFSYIHWTSQHCDTLPLYTPYFINTILWHFIYIDTILWHSTYISTIFCFYTYQSTILWDVKLHKDYIIPLYLYKHYIVTVYLFKQHIVTVDLYNH